MQHVIEFQAKSGFLLGTMSETEFESPHAKFKKKTLENFAGKKDELVKALEQWNQLRFDVFEIEKRESMKPLMSPKKKKVKTNMIVMINVLILFGLALNY